MALALRIQKGLRPWGVVAGRRRGGPARLTSKSNSSSGPLQAQPPAHRAASTLFCKGFGKWQQNCAEVSIWGLVDGREAPTPPLYAILPQEADRPARSSRFQAAASLFIG